MKQINIFILLLNISFNMYAGKNNNDLTNLNNIDSSFMMDIKYATKDNITKKKLYSLPFAYLNEKAAKALCNVNKKLKLKGFGIVIFDAYRPLEITKKLWNACPQKKRIFFADPIKGSNHNRGIAVDVSLYEANSHKQVKMPSKYDELNEKASIFYYGGTLKSRKLRKLLIDSMESEGFKVNPNEWWHFDYTKTDNLCLLNIKFKDLKSIQ